MDVILLLLLELGRLPFRFIGWLFLLMSGELDGVRNLNRIAYSRDKTGVTKSKPPRKNEYD